MTGRGDEHGLADPRLLVAGAGALVISGVMLIDAAGTLSTVIGGFAAASAGVLAWVALEIKLENE